MAMSNSVPRRSSRNPKRIRKCDIVAGVLSVAVAAPAVFAPSVAFAKVDRELLAAFAGNPVVSAAELDKQRGGFLLSNGAMVNIGMEVQQFVNNTLQNDVKMTESIINHLTVSQTTPSGTTTQVLSQLPAGGLTFQTMSGGGATNEAVTVTNNAIQTITQNSQNNLALKTVTTLNISTQGLANVLHQASTNFQIINSIRMNGWHH